MTYKIDEKGVVKVDLTEYMKNTPYVFDEVAILSYICEQEFGKEVKAVEISYKTN